MNMAAEIYCLFVFPTVFFVFLSWREGRGAMGEG